MHRLAMRPEISLAKLSESQAPPALGIKIPKILSDRSLRPASKAVKRLILWRSKPLSRHAKACANSPPFFRPARFHRDDGPLL